MDKVRSFAHSVFRALFNDVFEGSYKKRHYISFSVATGLFWAFTPTVFVQQAAIFIYWLLVRKTRLDFHLPIAWAWTWISNPWTVVPLYLIYYYTGALILQLFSVNYAINFELNFESVSLFWNSVEPIIFPLVIGSLIFSTTCSIVGYWLIRTLMMRNG